MVKKIALVLLCSLSLSFCLAWVKFFWPGPKFVGSPPRQTCARNSLDLSPNNSGYWYAKYGKTFRPSRPLYSKWGWLETMKGPSLFAGPLVEYFSGWDVYEEEICDIGKVADLTIWPDDGDFNFHLLPLQPEYSPGYARYGWRPDHPEDRANHKLILVEIDGGPMGIRDNFPILPEVKIGDLVMVCGRWVYDRAHDHNEIHPTRWLQILKRAP